MLEKPTLFQLPSQVQITGNLACGNLHSFQLLPAAPNTLVTEAFSLVCIAEVFL